MRSVLSVEFKVVLGDLPEDTLRDEDLPELGDRLTAALFRGLLDPADFHPRYGTALADAAERALTRHAVGALPPPIQTVVLCWSPPEEELQEEDCREIP